MRAATLILFLVAFIFQPPAAGASSSRSARTPLTPPTLAITGFRDVGPLDPNVTVVGAVYVPLRNLPLLYYYAEQTSAPGSALYHRYLTREEAQRLFYPEAEFRQALGYVRSQGLRVVLTAADSMIVFAGEAWQVERAFGVKIDVFTNGTVTFYADVGPAMNGPWEYPYVSNATLIAFARPRFLSTVKELEPVAAGLASMNVSFPVQAYALTELATAYNVTPLYARGLQGQNVSVGVLDYFGDPTLYQEVAYFDGMEGLPPTNITVVPIGPYNPDLGVATGWSLEEDLDVETIHSMAPRARIIVYVANGNVPLSAAIAFVDQQDAVAVLGQSFGIPESELSQLGWSFFYYNVFLSDVYYSLGAAEGITFVAASGDEGGMGYSAGPLGDLAYPASSPWVLAVGGTITYLSGGFAVQTAWSAIGLPPYDQNSGGTTGGYSAVEPTPPWQEAAAPRPPGGFPLGRAVPDVSANAGLTPGVVIVGEGNQTLVVGGTSEAAELVAGLAALLGQASGSRLGLLAPSLYYAYSSGACKAAFDGIIFGYDIPWTARPGYNLLGGLGALNVGILSYCLGSLAGTNSSIAIEVYVNGNRTSFISPGQELNVTAKVQGPWGSVWYGDFRVSLVTLSGAVATTPMTYNMSDGLWTSVLRAPENASGITYVEVSGESGWLYGYGMAEAFMGYFATILAPVNMYPYVPQLGLPVYVLPVSPTGNFTLSVVFNATVLEYEPINNTYHAVLSAVGQPYNLTMMRFNASPGYAALWVGGQVYGFTTFYVGDLMQYFMAVPQVLASPGSTYPGGWILVEGVPVPPVQTLFMTSSETGTSLFWAAMYGSNVTAELLAPNGTVVSSSTIPLTTQGYYEGLLWVPPRLRPGYYAIEVMASYNSTAAGIDLEGIGLGYVYVATELRANVTVQPSYAPYGGAVNVTANITYVNGTPVTFGVFSVTLVPQALEGLYENASQSIEVPLSYSPALGEWATAVSLPSPTSIGNATYYEGAYRGLWDVILAGEGAWGNELPYSATYLWLGEGAIYEGVELTSGFVASGAVFYNVSISYDGVISWSLMQGTVKVYSSDLKLDFVDSEGSLVVFNSNVTLRYSTAATIVLVDSRATLIYSDVDKVVIGPNSSVTVIHSRVGWSTNISAWESSGLKGPNLRRGVVSRPGWSGLGSPHYAAVTSSPSLTYPSASNASTAMSARGPTYDALRYVAYALTAFTAATAVAFVARSRRRPSSSR